MRDRILDTQDLEPLKMAAARAVAAGRRADAEVAFREMALDRVPLPIVEARPTNGEKSLTFTRANPASIHFLRGDPVGQPLEDIIPPGEQLEAHRQALRERLSGERRESYLDVVSRRTVLRFDGEEAEIYLLPFGDGDGDVGWRFSAVMWPTDVDELAALVRHMTGKAR